jgi:hypothetical protein
MSSLQACNCSVLADSLKSEGVYRVPPGVKVCGTSGVSYQNLSPLLSLTNWSVKRHIRVGPKKPPSRGCSASAPVYRSMSSTELQEHDQYERDLVYQCRPCMNEHEF